ncbi:hypothetical protein EX30DRAFT_250153 [Ascodesmis nigricans]|uniref:Uncharacterized protein n=1 Tax=Ascodesmis nigricans TaxID=341454 RepID=A0A4S2MYG0_9PEZI|nr:hypothetical protein EX30DRAFT_250153 [Ascodesmis nigricans]
MQVRSPPLVLVSLHLEYKAHVIPSLRQPTPCFYGVVVVAVIHTALCTPATVARHNVYFSVVGMHAEPPRRPRPLELGVGNVGVRDREDYMIPSSAEREKLARGKFKVIVTKGN